MWDMRKTSRLRRRILFKQGPTRIPSNHSKDQKPPFAFHTFRLTGNSSPARQSLPSSYPVLPFPSSNPAQAHPRTADHAAPRTCTGTLVSKTFPNVASDVPVENLLFLLRTDTPVLEQQIQKLALPQRINHLPFPHHSRTHLWFLQRRILARLQIPQIRKHTLLKLLHHRRLHRPPECLEPKRQRTHYPHTNRALAIYPPSSPVPSAEGTHRYPCP